MKRDDSGPAFPHSGSALGITRRDYFATAALTGVLANGREGYDNHPVNLAEYVYKIADAMLEVRSKAFADATMDRTA